MSLDPFLLMLFMLILSLGSVVLWFLPSIIEIRKPRDNGPRRILRKSLQRSMRSGSLATFALKRPCAQTGRGLKELMDLCEEADVQAQCIGHDSVRFLGDVAVPCGFEVSQNIVVEGALIVCEGSVLHGSAKAYGDVLVEDSVVIHGNLVSKLNVRIMDDVVIGGSVHAEGFVRLGERVFVGLSVVAGGDVELFENCEVKKNILGSGCGVIKVLRCPKVNYPPAVQDIG